MNRQSEEPCSPNDWPVELQNDGPVLPAAEAAGIVPILPIPLAVQQSAFVQQITGSGYIGIHNATECTFNTNISVYQSKDYAQIWHHSRHPTVGMLESALRGSHRAALQDAGKQTSGIVPFLPIPLAVQQLAFDQQITGSGNIVIHNATERTFNTNISVYHQSKAATASNIPQQESSPDEYPMVHNPRGICMIINNEQFLTHGKLGERKGSEKDAVKLKNLFSKLHFKVLDKTNLKKTEMEQLLKEVSQEDHSEYDCFVLFIMSHGKLGVVYGTDNEQLKIKDILNYFKPVSCPSLKSKPKLIFIQACQGKVNQGVDLQTDGPQGMGSGMLETVPDEADFLLGYATVQGYTSLRSTISGSWYIEALEDAITKYHNELDFLRILVRVNADLSARHGKLGDKNALVKQIAVSCQTLRKDLYLRTSDK